MKTIHILATISLCISTPSNSQDSRSLLWKNVFAGMTATEFQSLYPVEKGKVAHKKEYSALKGALQVGQCSPFVDVHYPKGVVTEVIVNSAPKGFFRSMCGNEAESALLANYGSPTSKDERSEKQNGLYKNTLTGRDVRYIRIVWVKENLAITFLRNDPDQEDRWSIRYAEVGKSEL